MKKKTTAKAIKEYKAAYDNLTDLAYDYDLPLGETARITLIDHYEDVHLLTYEMEEEIYNLPDEEAIKLFCTVYANI